MSSILGLVESPAQLLNAIEWSYADQAEAHVVVLGPPDPVTRLQLHRLAELANDHGFRVSWADVRMGAGRLLAYRRLAQQVRRARTVVLADPYSGVCHALLNLARNPEVVVVDDGTATLHYAKQWASGEPLQRWHLPDRGGPATRLIAARAQGLLGRRSSAVRLFTAMPVTQDIPLGRNEYAWTRATFGPPEVLDGIDLLGTSLVETGTIGEPAYLNGVARLVQEEGVRRYLPHRREQPAKLAAIRAMGVDLVRPDLPLEIHARRGPIGRELWSFPSTVLYTLPLVLRGSPVRIRPLAIEDDWFAGDADSKAFITNINPVGVKDQGAFDGHVTLPESPRIYPPNQ